MSKSCLLCGELGGADLVRNILMFMPAGVFLVRRGFSPILAVGLGFLLSSGIEFAQLFIPGRHASARDVLINGIGAGVGALTYLALLIGTARQPRLTLVAAVLFPLLTVLATGWLLAPTATNGTYYAQWVPERPYYAAWDGVLLDAQIDGVRTPIGRLRNSDVFREALQSGAPVTLHLRRGMATTALAAVYVVMDDSQREILMIGISGEDLVVRHRLRSTEFRLDLPDERFHDFLHSAAPSDVVKLRMTRDRRGRTCVATERRSACSHLRSLGAIWSLVLWKGELAPPLRRLVDGAAVALLLLPASTIVGLRWSLRSLSGFVAVMVAFALLGRGVGLSWPGITEPLGALGALAVGRWLARELH